jgi:lysozyme family protein
VSNELFLEAWKETGRAEGGYVNDPSDSGGETNWGITKKVARDNGYMGDMRELPKELAQQIAKREYWDVMKLDQVADLYPRVALELFDSGFNMGTSAPQRFLQRSLNALNRVEKDYPDMTVDGRIGGVTLSALAAYKRKRGNNGRIVLLRLLNALQANYYVELVESREKDEKFIFGWVLNRVDI